MSTLFLSDVLIGTAVQQVVLEPTIFNNTTPFYNKYTLFSAFSIPLYRYTVLKPALIETSIANFCTLLVISETKKAALPSGLLKITK